MRSGGQIVDKARLRVYRRAYNSTGKTWLQNDSNPIWNRSAMKHTTNSPVVSVIVPVFNEEENVPILQAELKSSAQGHRSRIHFCR